MELQEAKDLAAIKYGHGDFQQALGYFITENDVIEMQEIEDRAMTIYAEAKNKELIEALKEIERTVTQGAYSSETITRIISKVIEL